jgi:hypothetical protein
MIILSSLVKFTLYSLFIIFSVNYLTKNRLDNNSQYLIIALLIIPYLFIDTILNSTNENDNESFKVDIQSDKKNIIEIKPFNKQPEIILSKNEEITNKNVEEEIRLKEKMKQKNIEHFNTKPETKSDEISEEQIRKILNLIKKEKLIENLDGSSNESGLVQISSNKTEPPVVSTVSNISFSNDPSLQPLGMNGKGFTNEWDQDYVLLSTDKWAPTMKPAPVCKVEKECPVCPSLTSGYPISVREFESSRKIMPPIEANVTAMNK